MRALGRPPQLSLTRLVLLLPGSLVLGGSCARRGRDKPQLRLVLIGCGGGEPAHSAAGLGPAPELLCEVGVGVEQLRLGLARRSTFGDLSYGWMHRVRSPNCREGSPNPRYNRGSPVSVDLDHDRAVF